MIAARQIGHHAFPMELDSLYCEVLVPRYEQSAGRKSRRPSVSEN
jgi:hypothetical protein